MEKLLKMPKSKKRQKQVKAKSVKIAEIAEIAKNAESEIVRFFETFENWVVFGKLDGLFEEVLIFFSKSPKVFAVECVSNGFFTKMSPA